MTPSKERVLDKAISPPTPALLSCLLSLIFISIAFMHNKSLCLSPTLEKNAMPHSMPPTSQPARGS